MANGGFRLEIQHTVLGILAILSSLTLLTIITYSALSHRFLGPHDNPAKMQQILERRNTGQRDPLYVH